LRGTAAGGAFLAFFAAAGRKIPQNMNLRYLEKNGEIRSISKFIISSAQKTQKFSEKL
jgi:hypothetical protein